MKFLRDRSLRQIGFSILVLMFAIYSAEYFIIRYKIDGLDEVEQKLDYTRTIQLSSQQIAMMVNQYIAGDTTHRAEIEASLLQQDHLLKILGDGGRIDGTDIELLPLSRLPRISYDNLTEYWKEYKNAVSAIVTGELQATMNLQVIPADSTIDTTAVKAMLPPVISVEAAIAKSIVRQESLSITITKWYNLLFDDLENEVAKKKNSVNNWVIAIILFDIALLGAVFFLFDQYALRPVVRLTQSTAEHRQVLSLPQDEIGHLSIEINETLENLKDATDFVTAIGQGNLDMDYKETLDSGYVLGKNKLADSLIDMQQKLKLMNEEEKKRQWANEGLTKFVEILRSSSDNISELGDKIISALVKYTKSNQGGLYILNDDEENNKHLELISMFAFDIKKFEKQTVKLGEGVLGQTFLERETTYLRDIPEEYVRITSGLGDATPKAILMVPLKVDLEVYGIVELASFKEYEDHEIAFVERLGETIASTLASVRAAQKNKTLIEQFQQQTEEMRAQEEEMRQNMEELQATQEEIARKERTYIARIQELEQQSGGQTSRELEEAKAEFSKKERDYQDKIKSLERELAQKPARGDDWQIAEELEKTLTIHLEALKITQEELNRKVQGRS
jgi:GAF domain-containing protein